MFHNTGGTYETFFARGKGTSTLQQNFGRHGAGQLCNTMRGRAQSEVDMKAWKKYLDGLSRDTDFRWVKPEEAR